MPGPASAAIIKPWLCVSIASVRVRPYKSYHLNVNRRFTRRTLLMAASAAAAAHLDAARPHITKARVAVITDEAGRTQTDALAFAKQHGLELVELRTVPETQKEFAYLSEPELKRYAAELSAGKLKCSLLKTSLLKFQWPAFGGGEPQQKRWDARKDDLAKAIHAARILGTDKIRVFTGARVPNPSDAFPAIAKAFEELIPIAEAAGMHLLIENEPTQNVGTSAELKNILDSLPSKTLGFNWDPQNAIALHETAWPDGYALLPKARMMNMQVKAEALAGGSTIRWRSLFETMQKDGYTGPISLATEIFDGTFDKANTALGDLLHIVGELS
jgi:sugar phosphate isomerase/epimerase